MSIVWPVSVPTSRWYVSSELARYAAHPCRSSSALLLSYLRGVVLENFLPLIFSFTAERSRDGRRQAEDENRQPEAQHEREQ